ncbi:MAG: hypothetical protein MMC33_009778 [Icmadophila ericetorum]|nr:hypothetical protein [Icmadophila ericetorum]
MYIPNSKWTWFFTVLAFVQTLIILGFESYVFAEFQINIGGNPPVSVDGQNLKLYKTIPTFLTLFIFGMLYQLVLVWDALRLKNTIQIIGICMYNVGLMIYAAVQIDQIEQAAPNIWLTVRPFLIAMPCIFAFFTILLSFVAWRLYDEFAWTIYKHISADLRMKRRYLTFQIYIALLKFDFFFFLGFTIQFVVIVIDTKDPEFGLTIAAIPVTIIILLLAAYWTRKENKPGMFIIIFLYHAALAYFIFKLVRIYHGPKVAEYAQVKKELTVFAAITIILIILTIANAIVCTINFNKGLKPHLVSRKLESEDEKAHMTEMPNLSHGPVPSRMTIE